MYIVSKNVNQLQSDPLPGAKENMSHYSNLQLPADVQ